MQAKVLLAVVVLCTTVQVSRATDDPIDQYEAACISANSTTAGMTNCTNGAYSRWDKALNVAYVNLLSSLSPGSQQTLRAAQRQWILYRDSEFKMIDEIYKDKDGTMFIPMRAADRLEIVKARVLQLKAYHKLNDL